MPLRYLQLPETQYIPKHIPISENLLGRSSEIVANQTQQALEYEGTLYDEMRKGVQATTAGLPSEFQEEVGGIFEDSREKLEQMYEQKGPRGAYRGVRRLAGEFTEKLAPYQQVAGQKQQYLENLKQAAEKNKVDPNVVRWAQETANIKRDEYGNLTFSAVPTEVFNTWEDLSKKVADFSKSWNSSTEASEQLINSPHGDYIMRSMIEHGRADVFQAAAASLLVNDPATREQLEYRVLSRGEEATEENIIDEAMMIAAPEIANQKFFNEKYVQRVEQKAEEFDENYNPSFRIGQQGNPQFQSLKNVLEARDGFNTVFAKQRNELDRHLNRQRAENPEIYEGAKIIDKDGKYVIVDRDGNEIDNDFRVHYINAERKAYQAQKDAHDKLLDDVTREVTQGEYKTFEDYLENNEIVSSRENLIENLRKHNDRNLVPPNIESVEEYEQRIENLAEKKLQANHPHMRQITQTLKDRFATTETQITPSPVSDDARKRLEEIWPSVRSSGAILDRQGVSMEEDPDLIETLPEEAQFLGYVYTRNGIEFMWQPKATKEGQYSDIVRTKPNPSQIESLKRSGSLTESRAMIYDIVSRTASTNNPANTESFDVSGETVRIKYVPPTDNAPEEYQIMIPDEWVEESIRRFYATPPEEREDVKKLPNMVFYKDANSAAFAIEKIITDMQILE